MAAGSSWELGMSGQVEAPSIFHRGFSQPCVCVSEAGDAVRDGKQALIISAHHWQIQSTAAHDLLPFHVTMMVQWESVCKLVDGTPTSALSAGLASSLSETSLRTSTSLDYDDEVCELLQLILQDGK